MCKELVKREARSYIESAMAYLFQAGEVSDIEAFSTKLVRNLDKETGSNVMTIAEQFRAKGRAEGMAKGKTEGEAKSKRQIALNALQHGLAPAVIAELTGLSVAEVEALQPEAVH